MMFLLIRHSAVEVNPLVESTGWALSEHGRSAIKTVAHRFHSQKPNRILTSIEQKAVQTGVLLAQEWQVHSQTFPNLHEHERAKNEFVNSHEQWQQMVARFLSRPGELVLGIETAVQAAQRFETAVQAAKAQFPNKKLAFVSHGRILTAFLSQHNPQIEPVAFWQALKLPDLILIDPETYKIENYGENNDLRSVKRKT